MSISKRYLSKPIKEDLKEKMVFLGGPRQVGKTTFATDIIAPSFKASYFNWDKASERKKALNGKWPSGSGLIILDEFHKYKKWKTWIKGEYDHYKNTYKFLLTGSARLNIYRKGGDSLQGRYHYYTLHPFTLSETLSIQTDSTPGDNLVFEDNPDTKQLEELLEYGGFPEPFLKKEQRFLRRWQNERLDRLIKEDIRDLTALNDLGSLALLADLLPDRVASILSINSLANDLQVNHRTMANWLDIFEQFYYCFRLPPYQTKKIASVRKEKKLYLWDWTLVQDIGAKLENLVASHLLKFCHYLYEHDGWKVNLYFLRDSTGRETDFLVTFNEKPWFLVEVKNKDKTLSKPLLYFKEKLKVPYCYQIIKNFNDDYLKNDIRVMSVNKFLTALT